MMSVWSVFVVLVLSSNHSKDDRAGVDGRGSEWKWAARSHLHRTTRLLSQQPRRPSLEIPIPSTTRQRIVLVLRSSFEGPSASDVRLFANAGLILGVLLTTLASFVYLRFRPTPHPVALQTPWIILRDHNCKATIAH